MTHRTEHTNESVNAIQFKETGRNIKRFGMSSEFNSAKITSLFGCAVRTAFDPDEGNHCGKPLIHIRGTEQRILVGSWLVEHGGVLIPYSVAEFNAQFEPLAMGAE